MPTAKQCRSVAARRTNQWDPLSDPMERHAQFVPPLLIFAVAGAPQKLLEQEPPRRQHSQHCQRGLGFGHGLHGRVVGEVLEASAVGAHDVVMDDEPLGDALAAKNAETPLQRESIAARAQPLFDPCGRSREMLMVRRPKTNSPMKVLLPEPDGPGITKRCLSALAAATPAARSPVRTPGESRSPS